MGTCLPEAGIKDSDKWLHPTDNVGCIYLSLSLIHVPTSGSQVLLCYRLWIYQYFTNTAPASSQELSVLENLILFYMLSTLEDISLMIRWCFLYIEYSRSPIVHHNLPSLNQKATVGRGSTYTKMHVARQMKPGIFVILKKYTILYFNYFHRFALQSFWRYIGIPLLHSHTLSKQLRETRSQAHPDRSLS